MKIHITVFSYQRKEMLEDLIEEIKTLQKSFDLDYDIFDDGSDFSIDDCKFHQYKHGGKRLFWKMFDRAFKSLESTDYDIYVFTQSDMNKLDLQRIVDLHSKYKDKEYCYSLHRDDRMNCWNNRRAVSIDDESYQSWFTDCAFFTNKKTLNQLDHTIYEVNPLRFIANPTISSGVGQQLTQRLNIMKIPMFLPKKSLTIHIGHESLMHPEERKRNPLKSK